MTSDERDQQWAQTAIQRELLTIGGCMDDNPHIPDSEWWKAVFRIASVLKGSGKRHFTPSNVLTAVLRESPHTLRTKGDRNKDITYLWGRATNQAKPRYRIKTASEANAKRPNLSPVKPYPTAIYKHDLRTGKTIKTDVTPKIAAKSRELAELIQSIMQDQKNAQRVNFGRYGTNGSVKAKTLNHLPNGNATLRLQFRRYSKPLHQCVICASSILNSGILDYDERRAIFDLILRPEHVEFTPRYVIRG